MKIHMESTVLTHSKGSGTWTIVGLWMHPGAKNPGPLSTWQNFPPCPPRVQGNMLPWGSWGSSLLCFPEKFLFFLLHQRDANPKGSFSGVNTHRVLLVFEVHKRAILSLLGGKMSQVEWMECKLRGGDLARPWLSSRHLCLQMITGWLCGAGPQRRHI